MSNSPESKRAFVLSRVGVARISSGIGALALIVAVLSWVVQGDVTPIVLISALVAIVGLGLWMSLMPGDLRALLTGRQAIHGSNSILVTVLFAGCVAIIYTLAQSSGVAVDLTSIGYYTLKSDVRPVIDDLDRPIQITAFYKRSLLGTQSAESPILKMFADASPQKVRLVYVDPDEQPTVAKSFGMTGSFGVYVSFLNADGSPDLRANSVVKARGDYVTETFIAEAILQLEARGKFKVVFSTGGGEVNVDTTATGIRDGLKNVGIDVGMVDLSREDIPQGTTALVILAPSVDLSQASVDKIAVYLANGGKMLLMAEPNYNSVVRFMIDNNSPMAKYLWDTWGVRPQHDIVFDPVSYNTSQYYVLASKFAPDNKIVAKDEAGTPAQPLFAICQSWEIAPKAPDNVTVTVLYATSDSAFGKIDLREVAQNPDRVTRGANDVPGPLTLALSAENSVNGARIVAVGDADWISNDQIVAYDGQVLWTNMIDWLTQFLSRITVNPVMSQLPLNVSTSELNTAIFITMLVLPGAVLIAGGLVWWRRARR